MLTARRANDPLLDPLVEAETAEARQRAIEDLFAVHVYDRVDRILSAKFRHSSFPPDERYDLRTEIVLRLMRRLQRIADEPDDDPITSFGDYVAVVAFHGFDDHLRRTHPNRTRLHNRIRYTLEHDRHLALWRRGGTAVAGLAGWRGHDAAAAVPSLTAGLAGAENDLSPLLKALFERARHPIDLDELVSLMARVLGVTDRRPDPIGKDFAAPNRNPSEQLEKLEDLRAVWDEICELPRPQRIALLLNARDSDGDSVAHLLPATGVATVRQIAQSMEMDAPRLAELWPDLPLDDARIAAILRATREQVIGYRRAARERLARRLRDGGRSRKGRT